MCRKKAIPIHHLRGTKEQLGIRTNAAQQRDVDSATDLAFSCLIKATEHLSWKTVIPIKVSF